MNFFYIIHRLAVVLNVIIVEFALFISLLCCNHDLYYNNDCNCENKQNTPVEDKSNECDKKIKCYYEINSDNEQAFFENKRKTRRLFHSKIIKATIKQNGEKPVHVSNISMSKFRKLVVRTFKTNYSAKKYGMNHRDSIKEIARHVFSKNNGAYIKIKLQDVYGKPYGIRVQ